MPARINMDRDEVERLYVEEGLSTEQVAEELGVSQGTVHNRLIEWSVPRSRNSPGRITDEEYVEEIKWAAAELGQPPTSGQFERMSERTASGACARFGSWRGALRAAGLDPGEARANHGNEPNRHLSDREWLREALVNGLSYAEIGRRAGTTAPAVPYWIKKHGLDPGECSNPSGGKHAAPEDEPQEAGPPITKEGPRADERLGERWWLHSRLARGGTLADAAEECGVSKTIVRHWRDKHSIPPDPDPRYAGGLSPVRTVVVKGSYPARVHTDPGCHMVAGDDADETKAGDVRPHLPICKFCTGEHERPSGVTARELAAMDPEDLGLSPPLAEGD